MDLYGGSVELSNPIFLCVALVIGTAIGWYLNTFLGSKSVAAAKKEHADLLEEATSEVEDMKQEARLKMKDERAEMVQSLENDIQDKATELKKTERQIKEREVTLDKRISDLEKSKKDLEHRELVLDNEKKRIAESKDYYRELIDKANERLETIAEMSKDEALENLKENLIADARQHTDKIITDMFEEARRDAQHKAKDVVLQSINQTASEHSVESTIAVVNLPDDAMKGRIIGREGRNIRSFEMNTGVDILIDDTPKTIVLSCFDPVRREIGKIALERLIEDGRIHPGRIEDVVEKVREEMNDRHFETGETALFDLGIHGVHSDLVNLLGRLRFRSKSGQNVLKYSIEVANIASLIATNLGFDPHLAKRVAILHEVGRVVDKVDVSVKDRTIEILKKHNEKPIIIEIVEAIGEATAEGKHPMSIIVDAAKSISESRPGARKEVYETHVKRLGHLEEIAKSFDGVDDAYAIQAGRELRVMIDYDDVNDENAELLAASIVKKIEDEEEYPGQIKVTIFREFRSVDYAK